LCEENRIYPRNEFEKAVFSEIDFIVSQKIEV